MIKTAIFVEGQTELVFVREMLLRVFDPNDLSFKCYRFLSDNIFPAEYDYRPDLPTAFYFQIVQVGNDEKVLDLILTNERLLWNTGYFRIIGLRDMFSPAYRKQSQGQISESLNRRIIESAQAQFAEQSQSDRLADIHFRYAIMEVEAWLLGMKNAFGSIDFSSEDARNRLGFDLAAVDPEATFLHPAMQVKQVLELAGKSYDKHRGEVEAMMSPLEREDFFSLRDSGKCASFASFFASLPNEADFLAAMR